MLPKDKRKEAYKRRKDEKEVEQAEKVMLGRKERKNCSHFVTVSKLSSMWVKEKVVKSK